MNYSKRLALVRKRWVEMSDEKDTSNKLFKRVFIDLR